MAKKMNEIEFTKEQKKEARTAYKNLKNAVLRLGRSETRKKLHTEEKVIQKNLSRLRKVA